MPGDKTKEVSFKASSNITLDLQLQLLNNFMFNLCYLPDGKMYLLKQNLKSIPKEPSHFNTLLTNCRDSPSREHFLMSNPDSLFLTIKTNPLIKDHLQPMVGLNERHSLLFNKDLILGMQINLPKHDLSIHYRLDFDDKKKLHLNVDVTVNGNLYPLAITHLSLTPSRRFFVEKIIRERFGKTLVGEHQSDLQMDMVKFKFFVKMTLAALIHGFHPKTHDNLFLKHLETLGYNEPIAESIKKPDIRKKITTDLIAYYDNQRKTQLFKNLDIPQLESDSELPADSEAPSP